MANSSYVSFCFLLLFNLQEYGMVWYRTLGFNVSLNPLKGRGVNWLHLAIQV